MYQKETRFTCKKDQKSESMIRCKGQYQLQQSKVETITGRMTEKCRKGGEIKIKIHQSRKS